MSEANPDAVILPDAPEPPTADEVVPAPAVPASDQISYQRFWTYGFVAIGTAILSIFILNIVVVFLGFALLYVGIPYGFIAFVITAILHHRTGRKAAPVFGTYSVFGSFPQIASLFLNATLALLGLLLLIFFLPQLVTGSSITDGSGIGGTALFLALCYAPTAGGLLVGFSVPVFFSRKNIAQEQYAISNKLPARRWIRVHQILAVFVYAVVVTFAIVALVNS